MEQARTRARRTEHRIRRGGLYLLARPTHDVLYPMRHRPQLSALCAGDDFCPFGCCLGKATKLAISKDTLSSFAHPAVSPDGQWLYFVSDMPGGQGGQDLWRIRLTTNGLGEMENLGEPINTAGNECFPTFRPNGDLYFSSDGHVGLGGLDVICSAAKIPTNNGR